MLGFVTGIGGFALLMGIWVAVQSLARGQSHCERDRDMLEGHGCGACDHSGACHKR